MIDRGAVLLRVSDVETSRRFYEDLLGFRPVGDPVGAGLALGVPGLVLLLVPRSIDARRPEHDPFSFVGLALSVANAEAGREELLAKGVTFEGEIVDLPAGRVAFFLDPDGYTLGLIERRA
jgi:catechol 2,3-dioxygenase-like lactoylglutathione lyase family enzyme